MTDVAAGAVDNSVDFSTFAAVQKLLMWLMLLWVWLFRVKSLCM